jgi:hypothetical protein
LRGNRPARDPPARFLPGIRWRSAAGVARDEIGDLVTYHCDDAAA